MWLYTVTIQIEALAERHTAYLWAIVFLIAFSVILLLRYQLLSMEIGGQSLNKVTQKKRIDFFKPIKYFTFAAYAYMSIYLLNIYRISR